MTSRGARTPPGGQGLKAPFLLCGFTPPRLLPRASKATRQKKGEVMGPVTLLALVP